MIRVWNVNLLVEELRADVVQERDKFHYILASAALHYLVGPVSLLSSPSWETLGWNTAAMIIGVFGIASAYSANHGDSGHSFIERYFCLSLPVIVRLYLVGYVVYYAANIAVLAFSPEYQAQIPTQRLVSVVFSVILAVAYFVWLRRAIQRVVAH